MTSNDHDFTNSYLKWLDNWISNHRLLFLILVITFIISLFVFSWAVNPTSAPSWTGFGEIPTSDNVARTPRTLWDWLDLLIVPAFLAGGAAWIARSQQKRELEEKEVDRELAEKAREVDRELAQKARETDRDIAKDRQQQLILENYYDRMAELLLTNNLRSKSAEEDEERSIARARTLAVLRSLDYIRKGLIVRFLYESRLIDLPNPVISLRGADLQYANLFGSDLHRADLKEVDLRYAELNSANLSGSDLEKAHLSGANASNSNLRGANLKGAELSMLIALGANLEDEYDDGIFRTYLRGANLVEADLSFARLHGVDFSEANLQGADLSLSIDLDKAILKDAIISNQTKLPPGFNVENSGDF